MKDRLKPGLKREHFAHPLDLSGMQGLMEKIVKTRLIERELAGLQKDVENEFYLFNLADNAKLGEKQGASLYRMVQEASARMNVSTPVVFLDRTSELRSCALGGKNPSLVFTSGLVDTFPDPAMKAVVGHELGHIICEHSFYRLMAENHQVFAQLAGFIPLLGPVVSFGIVVQLFDWYKKSELSADRAALLATGDISAVQDYILRLAGGSAKLAPELSLAEFTRQADEFQAAVKERRQQRVGRRLRILLSSLMLQRALKPNPWPIVRFQAITEWARSGQYASLLAGNYEEAESLGESERKDDELSISFELPSDDLMAHLGDLRNAATSAVSGFYKQVKAPMAWLTEEDEETATDEPETPAGGATRKKP